jgi:hypothetical protein
MYCVQITRIMCKKFYYLPTYIFFSVIISGYIFSQPVFVSVNENSGDIYKYEKYELTIELKAYYANPYDPEIVSLKGFLNLLPEK